MYLSVFGSLRWRIRDEVIGPGESFGGEGGGDGREEKEEGRELCDSHDWQLIRGSGGR